MKHNKRIVPLLCALVITGFVCFLSVPFKEAARAPILFEHCEDPITFSALARIAVRYDYANSGSACINNLRQIDGAKQEWALENHKTNADQVVTWKDIMPYIGTSGRRQWCSSGGVYRIGTLGTAPTCSVPGHKLN